MDNQIQAQIPPLNPPPPPSKISPSVFVLSMFVVAILSGGIVYFWQHQELVNFKNIPVKTTLVVTVSPTPIDRRVQLTTDQWNEKFQSEFKKGVQCDQFINLRFSSPPNTFVTYSNDANGYSIDFPYNSYWGDSENSVPPYELHQSSTDTFIGFNKPHGSEGCGPMRMSLRENPPSTIDQAIKLIEANNQKIRSDPNRIPEDGMATYTKLTNFKYPVLKMDTTNALMGSVVSYQVFLPKVTLDLIDYYVSDQAEYTQLIETIKTY